MLFCGCAQLSPCFPHPACVRCRLAMQKSQCDWGKKKTAKNTSNRSALCPSLCPSLEGFDSFLEGMGLPPLCAADISCMAWGPGIMQKAAWCQYGVDAGVGSRQTRWHQGGGSRQEAWHSPDLCTGPRLLAEMGKNILPPRHYSSIRAAN